MPLSNVVFLVSGYLTTPELPVALQWRNDEPQLPWQLTLCHLLGVDAGKAGTLPVARLLVEKGQLTDALVCADPVHLRADRDTATLLPAPMLALREHESAELIASLNAFVAEDGWRFFRDTHGRWFMAGLDGSALASYPPSFLAHRNASSFLPDGDDSEQWRRLMAEVQMLLHTHPVNQVREQRGQLPVNSLWFWGGGALPAVLPSSSKTSSPTVFADDPFAVALSQHLNVDHRPLQAFDPDVEMNAIVVDTRIASMAFEGDEQGMREVRKAIDEGWLVPICERIAGTQDGTLKLMNEDGGYGICDVSTLTQTGTSESVMDSVLALSWLPKRVRGWIDR